MLTEHADRHKLFFGVHAHRLWRPAYTGHHMPVGIRSEYRPPYSMSIQSHPQTRGPGPGEGISGLPGAHQGPEIGHFMAAGIESCRGPFKGHCARHRRWPLNVASFFIVAASWQ